MSSQEIINEMSSADADAIVVSLLRKALGVEEEQGVLVKESAAFVCDGNDIGCIPSLQMSIRLSDDIPV